MEVSHERQQNQKNLCQIIRRGVRFRTTKNVRDQVQNMSHFIRKMLLTGAIYEVDMTPFWEITKFISSISANINQIAYRVNKNHGELYKEDFEEMRKEINDLWQLHRSTVFQALKSEP